MNNLLPNGIKIGQAVAYGAALCVGWSLASWAAQFVPAVIGWGLQQLAQHAPAVRP